MVAMLTNPTNDIAGVFGKQAVGTFAIRPTECWPNHFDPKHVYREVTNRQ